MKKGFITWAVCAMLALGVAVNAAEKKLLQEASQVKLEALVPAEHETSPYMLNLLMVEVSEELEEVPNASTITYLKGQYEIKKYKFKNLIPRLKNDGFFKVSLKREMQEKLPLDLAGLGPFYLVKIEKQYYLLTPRNFETIFGGLRSEEEALNYLVDYENLFVSPVVCVVTEEVEKGLKKAQRTPPRLSKVVKNAQGYEVSLIIYSIIQVDGFFEKKVQVTPEGKVTMTQEPRLIQKLGDGVSF